MEKNLYICVDFQRDFVDGVLGTLEAQKIVSKCNKFLHKIVTNESENQLIYTMDTHDTNYLDTPEGKKLPIPHCIKYTNGWNLAVDKVVSNEYFIEKNTFCYKKWREFLENQYALHLYCPKNIYLFGLDTDICVISNALALKTLYSYKEVYIIEDLTAGSTPENKEAALKVAQACQINVINSAEVYNCL